MEEAEIPTSAAVHAPGRDDASAAWSGWAVPLADRDEANLALDYAQFQLSRPWIRFFWVWLAPGMILALRMSAGRLLSGTRARPR